MTNTFYWYAEPIIIVQVDIFKQLAISFYFTGLIFYLQLQRKIINLSEIQ